MPFVVGEVETPRLLLRPFRAGDLDDVHALQSDPEVVRYLPWDLRTREESQAWLQARIASPALEADDDAVAYAVESKQDRSVIGSISLFLRSVAHRQGEVGFVLSRAAQGRGYAHEATAAALDVAFAELDLHRIAGRADARNTASAALMTRLGMRQEAHLRECEWFKGEWGDLVVFAVLRDEWLRLRTSASTPPAEARPR